MVMLVLWILETMNIILSLSSSSLQGCCLRFPVVVLSAAVAESRPLGVCGRCLNTASKAVWVGLLLLPGVGGRGCSLAVD